MPNWKKLIVSGSDASLNSLNLSSVVNAGTDTDKFLVLDSSGNVDFRTGANVLSDIGGQASGTYVTDSGGAACQVAVWASGTAISGSNDLFFNTANNRLGIGASSPTQTLDVNGDIVIKSGGVFRIRRGSTDNAILFQDSGTDKLYLRQPNSNELHLQTNGDNTRLIITAAGNVGIGTTTPDEKTNRSR